MNTIDVALILGILGLFMGSFVAAYVWRLRAHQLREDEKAGEKVPIKDHRQVRQLKQKALLEDRSLCLHCGHQLSWYDLLPLVSWIQLKGRCRYCKKRIGYLEPLSEMGLALYFSLSYLFWPESLGSIVEVFHFVIWLIAGVLLAILFIYDAKWFLLPNRVVFPLIGVGVLNSTVVLFQKNFAPEAFMGIVYACLVLSGLYYLIYVISRYRWVGFGDIKLGLALALLMPDWRLAMLTLLLANVIGTLIVIPLMLTGRVKRTTHIPFGPLLISGWFISGLFGMKIIDWYLSFALGVA